MSESLGLVAWDVDDVLNPFAAAWAQDVGIERLSASPSAGDPTECFRSLGCSREYFLSCWDVFRASILAELAPNSLATEATKWLGEFDVIQIAVTKCPLRFGPTSSQWTLANFGNLLSGVLTLPSQRATEPIGYTHTKKGHAAALMVEPVAPHDTAANFSDVPPNCCGILHPQPWEGAQKSAFPDVLVQRVMDVFEAATSSGVRR